MISEIVGAISGISCLFCCCGFGCYGLGRYLFDDAGQERKVHCRTEPWDPLHFYDPVMKSRPTTRESAGSSTYCPTSLYSVKVHCENGRPPMTAQSLDSSINPSNYNRLQYTGVQREYDMQNYEVLNPWGISVAGRPRDSRISKSLYY